jgi:periplasmic divalent cation tolerance protein
MAEDSDQPVFIYTTFASKGDAEEVGGALVQERFAACVNIFPGMVSIYGWEGELERSNEVAMLVKTRRGVLAEAIAALRQRHPYDVPAVLVIPTEGGSAEYSAWIAQMTARRTVAE